MQREADALEIPMSDFENIISSLSRYRDRKNDDWASKLTEICQPVLRGQDITNQYAIESIAQLDDTDERWSAIARDILNDVRDQFGVDILNRLVERITEHGESVTFSKTDMVRVIEWLPNTDHRNYLIRQCELL